VEEGVPRTGRGAGPWPQAAQTEGDAQRRTTMRTGMGRSDDASRAMYS